MSDELRKLHDELEHILTLIDRTLKQMEGDTCPKSTKAT